MDIDYYGFDHKKGSLVGEYPFDGKCANASEYSTLAYDNDDDGGSFASDDTVVVMM